MFDNGVTSRLSNGAGQATQLFRLINSMMDPSLSNALLALTQNEICLPGGTPIVIGRKLRNNYCVNLNLQVVSIAGFIASFWQSMQTSG